MRMEAIWFMGLVDIFRVEGLGLRVAVLHFGLMGSFFRRVLPPVEMKICFS